MSKTKPRVPHKFISWFFILYYVILFGERLQSLIRAAANGVFWRYYFDGGANMLTMLSLVVSLFLFLFADTPMWKSLVSDSEPKYSVMAVTAGVVLVSGMIHTEYTIPGIQFAAYGMLIVAMILRTVQVSAQTKNIFGLWYSLAYVTVFSMAIPVVYNYYVYPWISFSIPIFHDHEFAIMLALVASFTVMLRRLFMGRGENLLMWIPFAVMVIGDAYVLWVPRDYYLNTFVLIFAALSVPVFIVGKIIFLVRKNK